ncbi:MAG: hypothetical protein KDK00_10495 [Rhodobacteraceae bacterium]|nr:hypothetical protein [Paracoccaceae bacterium]
MKKPGTMAQYEYKVVAAPRKTRAFKGVRSHEDQFAHVLAEVMNQMASEAWEYLRAESLPCEERTGLTSRVESYQSVLVFRRRIVNGQQFFETATPPSRQIELHQVQEDRSEHDVKIAHQDGPANVTALHGEMQETEERAGPAGVLSILRNRKARMTLNSGGATGEHLKLAGE